MPDNTIGLSKSGPFLNLTLFLSCVGSSGNTDITSSFVYPKSLNLSKMVNGSFLGSVPIGVCALNSACGLVIDSLLLLWL